MEKISSRADTSTPPATPHRLGSPPCEACMQRSGVRIQDCASKLFSIKKLLNKEKFLLTIFSLFSIHNLPAMETPSGIVGTIPGLKNRPLYTWWQFRIILTERYGVPIEKISFSWNSNGGKITRKQISSSYKDKQKTVGESFKEHPPDGLIKFKVVGATREPSGPLIIEGQDCSFR